MHKIICLLAGLLVAGAVSAGTVTLNWKAPLTGTDNTTPLTGVNAITGYRIEAGSCSGTAFGTKAGEWNVGNVTTYITPDLPAATYCFRTYAKTATSESGPSNVATRTVSAPGPVIPNPPTGLTVTATTAYEKRSIFGFSFAWAVGTVPLGTQCTTASLGQYRGVPATKVILTRQSVGGPYYARCA